MRRVAAIGLGLALVLAIGSIAVHNIDQKLTGKIDPAQAAFISRIRNELGNKRYFTPREIGHPDAVFFCVCGPYHNCDPQSRDLSRVLDYQRPPHNFVEGTARARSLLMYFLRDRIISIEVPHATPYFMLDHEAYCSADLDMKIFQRGS